MEWLLAHPIIMSLIGIAGVPFAIYLLNLFLPRRKVYMFGYNWGAFVRTFSLEKLGDKQGSKILNVICNTLSDFFGGLTDGTTGKMKNAPPGK